MTQLINPVKRDKSLIPLSHEHHHGLIFCSRLKKVYLTDETTLRSFVSSFWNNQLAEHFKKEELLLLPLLGDKDINKQFILEHQQIKELVQSILKESNEVKEDALVLAELINNHIRFEERILFPWMEKTLSPDELNTLGGKLKDTEIAKHHFLPEFWKNEN